MSPARATSAMAMNRKRLPNAVAMPATNVTSRVNWRTYGPTQPLVLMRQVRSRAAPNITVFTLLPQPGCSCKQHESGTLSVYGSLIFKTNSLVFLLKVKFFDNLISFRNWVFFWPNVFFGNFTSLRLSFEHLYSLFEY